MRLLKERNVSNLILAVVRLVREDRPLTEALRTQLITELEACITFGSSLTRYNVTVRLFHQPANAEETEQFLDEKKAQQILRQGLCVLTMEQLRRLALSPSTLTNLAKYIDDRPYECYHEGPWGEIFQRFVHEDMRRQGLDPEAEMAIAKAKWLGWN